MNAARLPEAPSVKSADPPERPEPAHGGSPGAFAEFFQLAAKPEKKEPHDSESEEPQERDEREPAPPETSANLAWLPWPAISTSPPPQPLPSPDLTACLPGTSQVTLDPETGGKESIANPKTDATPPTSDHLDSSGASEAVETDLTGSENDSTSPSGPAPPRAYERPKAIPPPQHGPNQMDEKPPPEGPKAPADLRGMMVAKSPITVEMMQQQDENAVSGQQNLPGARAFAEVSRKAAQLPPSPHQLAVNESLTSQPLPTPTTTATDDATVTPVNLHRLEGLEKLHAAVTDCTLLLKRADEQSLSVVIKPDAGTELTLHLRMHRGQVEATAEMQKGDRAAFEAGWKDLQQRLERQGVQLAALHSERTFDFQQRGQHQQHPPFPSIFNEEQSLPPVPPAKRVRVGAAHPQAAPVMQRCEYWA